MASFKTKYFFGDKELTFVVDIKNAEFEAKFPGVKGKGFTRFHKLVGFDPTVTPVWDDNVKKWNRGEMFPVERAIEYKVKPSKHVCDARCTNARGFKCECECGGKNHGSGNRFVCD